MNPEYYVKIDEIEYLAELSDTKAINCPPGCLTVTLYNISDKTIETGAIVSNRDLKPLEELGALARILYA